MATLTLDLPHAQPSIADSLPSANFGFDELRERMNKFTIRFDAFIEKERKRVLDERNQFRKNISELQADKQQRKQEIEVASLKAQTHASALAKENVETAEMHAQITNLKAHRDELGQQRQELQSELSSLQSTLSARRNLQTKQARYLHSQSRWNGPELQFWEDYLCMTIEGAGQPDRLKFVFTHVCEKQWEREAWFELDTSDREYKVLRTGPKVDREQVDACLERLNDGRELGPFFKGMRDIFVKAFK